MTEGASLMDENLRNAPDSKAQTDVVNPEAARVTAKSTAANVRAKTTTAGVMAKSAAADVVDHLQKRWEELKDRISEPNAVNRPSLTEELRADADYVWLRARYYHENRPLHALGLVAAGAFAVGLVIGLWRR
jgi:Na+(H+)/acetate symporter ActP